LAQVASYIPAKSGEMDAYFSGAGITVPITTSATHPAYLYVKLICAWGAAGEAEGAAFMGGNKNESEHSMSLLDRYYDALNRIVDNPSMLSALINGTQGATMNSYEYSNSGERRTDSEIPVMRGRDNW